MGNNTPVIMPLWQTMNSAGKGGWRWIPQHTSHWKVLSWTKIYYVTWSRWPYSSTPVSLHAITFCFLKWKAAISYAKSIETSQITGSCKWNRRVCYNWFLTNMVWGFIVPTQGPWRSFTHLCWSIPRRGCTSPMTQCWPEPNSQSWITMPTLARNRPKQKKVKTQFIKHLYHSNVVIKPDSLEQIQRHYCDHILHHDYIYVQVLPTKKQIKVVLFSQFHQDC